MVRKIRSRKWEREIRPRIKLYKFENLDEDVQNKLIQEQAEFYSDYLIDDIDNEGKEIFRESLEAENFKDIDFKFEEWDLDRNYLYTSGSAYYGKYTVTWKHDNWKNEFEVVETDDYGVEAPEKTYNLIKEIIENEEKHTLKAMRDSYNYAMDYDNIKKDLIEQDYLYTADGERE